MITNILAIIIANTNVIINSLIIPAFSVSGVPRNVVDYIKNKVS